MLPQSALEYCCDRIFHKLTWLLLKRKESRGWGNMANESQRKYFCPRLLDYVCIVGSRHPSRNNSVAQTPELLRRYPLEDHTDFPLAPDVVFFCQPEGCISTGPKRLSLRESTSFVFTLTEKDTGRVRYGICLNFYRPFERPRGSSTHERHKTERHTSCASTSSGEQTLGVPAGDGTDKPPKSPRTKRKQKTASRVRNHTLTSLCFISHHPFFSTFRECLFVLRQLIESCNDRSCTRRTGGSRSSNRWVIFCSNMFLRFFLSFFIKVHNLISLIFEPAKTTTTMLRIPHFLLRFTFQRIWLKFKVRIFALLCI